MEIRIAKERDYVQLAEMKWLHCEEDEIDYEEKILNGANKEVFVNEFINFLNEHKEYIIFVACENDVVVSAMFVYIIPKTPKPNRKLKYIAYLTNVYTRKQYRNKNIGTEVLAYIKEYLEKIDCELMFVWPSENSVAWYSRNGFCEKNEIFQCDL